ncbi:MAG: TRAP transporter fused permease subunit [Gammaproteobacteria bacterium]|nr:TRAP transporter fused permease subunit [Gammaproteobacteria bacterium]
MRIDNPEAAYNTSGNTADTEVAAIWYWLGATTIAFHLWLVVAGLLPNLVTRPLHMLLALPWIFVFSPPSTKHFWSGLVWLFVGAVACLWVAWQHAALGDQYGYLNGSVQLVFAVSLLLVTLLMARRAIGWPLPAVATLALLYGLFGQHLPGEFGFAPIPVNSFLGTLTIAEGGIWGKLTGISVNIVAVFVIFGAILNAGEAGQGFMNLALRTGGRLRGGAAKVSVIASALFGSISGSASANVASTGALTLPTMTRQGYPRALAAATEAVASSGGQIMPPLMGAGAFVMVELTGISYTDIMLASLPPALLYFFAVWVGIDAFSVRYQLKPVPAGMLPAREDVLRTSAFFALPFGVLLGLMFIGGNTPQYAAASAALTAIALLVFDKSLTVRASAIKSRLGAACLNAGKQTANIAAIIICASIIIGVLGITGLGVKITSLILSGSGGNLWLALLLTAIACLLLGMEVPTTAAYVICISIAGPALTELGLSTLQAHLFVFWFALLSTITPPVCGAVFIAAGMVGENWLRVAAFAMILGIGLYLIPPALIAIPALIMLKTTPIMTMLALAWTGLSLWCVSRGLASTAPIPLRLLLGSLGVIMLVLPAG